MALLPIVLFSCDPVSHIHDNSNQSGEIAELKISVCGAEETKVASQPESNEEKVTSLQVYVFRTDDANRLEISSFTGEHSITMKCSSGPKRIYALVNAPDIRGSVSSETDLLSCATSLSDNSVSALQMIGSTDMTLSTPTVEITVPVKRIAASVVLKKITNSFSSDSYKDSEFKITDVYLLNVQGINDYGLDSEPAESSSWYNRLSKDENPFPVQGVIHDGNIGYVITHKKEYSVVHTFYAYPNSAEKSSNASWTPRATLLVVETELDGVTYYYPIAIENIKSNCRYIINNLNITRPGSLNPYEPVEFTTCSFNIDVVPWTVALDKYEEI